MKFDIGSPFQLVATHPSLHMTAHYIQPQLAGEHFNLLPRVKIVKRGALNSATFQLGLSDLSRALECTVSLVSHASNDSRVVIAMVVMETGVLAGRARRGVDRVARIVLNQGCVDVVLPLAGTCLMGRSVENISEGAVSSHPHRCKMFNQLQMHPKQMQNLRLPALCQKNQNQNSSNAVGIHNVAKSTALNTLNMHTGAPPGRTHTRTSFYALSSDTHRC